MTGISKYGNFQFRAPQTRGAGKSSGASGSSGSSGTSGASATSGSGAHYEEMTWYDEENNTYVTMKGLYEEDGTIIEDSVKETNYVTGEQNSQSTVNKESGIDIWQNTTIENKNGKIHVFTQWGETLF